MDGPACVYFHGQPGGPEEGRWFAAQAEAAGVRLLPLDRAAMAPGAAGDGYFDALATEVQRLGGGGPVHLIGFSIGAFVAAETAARLPVPPASLNLVSAAAPLQPADLETMAGGPVFRIAQRRPALFAAATAMQGLLVRMAPGPVLRMLFADAGAAEAALASDPAFRRTVASLLQRSYGERRPGYLRDVALYVRWRGEGLGRLHASPTLWHGDADTWTPPDMAGRAAGLCPDPADVRIERLPGLGHYSTLFAAMPRILAGIGGRPA